MPRACVRAHFQRVRLQPVDIDDVLDGETGGAADWIARHAAVRERVRARAALSRHTHTHTHSTTHLLKYSWPANFSAISRVVTTAASGMPLPNDLPSVTMSGTTPCSVR